MHYDHILPKGLDHILLVLGLFFLSVWIEPLLWLDTAFTLASTVTPVLGAAGRIAFPGAVVEPLIAASIVFVAVENILSDGLSRWRPFVVFLFDLLHGQGLASVLGGGGLPQGQLHPASIGFNIGVEPGQLPVIAPAFLFVFVALWVDDGDTALRTGQLVYAAPAAGFLRLGWLLNTDVFADRMGAAAPVFLWPLAAVSLLCFLAESPMDRQEA